MLIGFNTESHLSAVGVRFQRLWGNEHFSNELFFYSVVKTDSDRR